MPLAPMKVVFLMHEPELKKHSTRFDFEKTLEAPPAFDEVAKKFKPQFYIPAPFMNAKRVKVTIEVVE